MADLETKLLGLPGLALANALNFRCAQGVQLVLVLRTPPAGLPSPLDPRPHGSLPLVRGAQEFALDVAQQAAQDRALAFEHAEQALELLGVCVATGPPAQPLASALVGLFFCQK